MVGREPLAPAQKENDMQASQKDLSLFSEWLDSLGLMVPPGDVRSHDDLAEEFIQEQLANDARKVARVAARQRGKVAKSGIVVCEPSSFPSQNASPEGPTTPLHGVE